MLPLVCVLAGVFLLALPRHGAVLRTVVAVGVIALGGAVLLSALRPFRFAIGPDGLTVRRPGLRRTIPWAQVEALVLDQPLPHEGRPAPPRLLLVPAAGVTVGLPPAGRHPVDGRKAVELLDLGQVRDRPEEVAAALARFAGDRFLDAHGARRSAFAVPDLTVGLRGYRTNVIDRLVRRGQEALAWGGAAERQAARDAIEQARAAGPVVAQRGYDQRQVDETLAALGDALADDRTTDREPTL
ncbi:hypothetical protein ACIBTV_22440 [Micromonospora sp. NPDC049366]|uniref:hypothetical protein n=1 Tax=Micromonospora sp. NPDC049366 TaxID=3364271 RepID=UPI00378908F5